MKNRIESEYKKIEGFGETNILLPSCIYDEFVSEFDGILVLAKMNDYIIDNTPSSNNTILINLYKLHESKKYTIAINAKDSIVSIVYVFSLEDTFQFDKIPNGVNVNDVRTMISAIDNDGMINCFKLFKGMI